MTGGTKGLPEAMLSRYTTQDHAREVLANPMALGRLEFVRQRPSNLLPRPPGPRATDGSVSTHREHLYYLQSLAKKIRLAAMCAIYSYCARK